MRRTKVFLAGAAAVAMLTACTGGGGGQGEQSERAGGGSAPAAAPAKNVATLVSNINRESAEKRTVKADLRISTPNGQGKVTGNGVLDLSRPASHFTLDTGPQGSVETIVIAGTSYLKAEGIPVAEGKPWAKIAKNSNNPLAKFVGSVGDQAQQADPSKTIDQVKAGGKITETGRERLNGQQTTKYVITVDLQKAADRQTNPMLKQLMQLAVRSGVKQFPITMWVNRENLPVQMKVDSPVPSTGGGQQKQGSFTTLVRYRDWGVPVQIQPPPASQVGELRLPKLPENLGQRQGGN